MKAVVCATLTCLWLAAAPARAASPLEGRWITASGNLEVTIAACGIALCGTVTQVLANHSMTPGAAPMQPKDKRTPLGMTILSDVRADGDKAWQGRIYNRENASSYDCTLALQDDGLLNLRAYKGIPLFGKTQLWKRVQP
ncbi:MAG: DUF2147 domain-containing protein [Gammaproteobacteria bacterium]